VEINVSKLEIDLSNKASSKPKTEVGDNVFSPTCGLAELEDDSR